MKVCALCGNKITSRLYIRAVEQDPMCELCAHVWTNLMPETNEEHDATGYESTAQFLFQLLDDIDTVSDMAKGDDAAYRRLVTEIQHRRFEVAETDGYTVTFKARP